MSADQKTKPEIFNNTLVCFDLRLGKQVWSFDSVDVASDINAYRRYKISQQMQHGSTHPPEAYDWVAFSQIAISFDGAKVAAMRAIDSTIYLLDARTGKLRGRLCFPLGKAEFSNPSFSFNLLFAPDGKHLFAKTNDSIFAWDLTKALPPTPVRDR